MEHIASAPALAASEPNTKMRHIRASYHAILVQVGEGGRGKGGGPETVRSVAFQGCLAMGRCSAVIEGGQAAPTGAQALAWGRP